MEQNKSKKKIIINKLINKKTLLWKKQDISFVSASKIK